MHTGNFIIYVLGPFLWKRSQILVYITCLHLLHSCDLYIWACAHVLSILDRETIIMHRLQAVILEHTNILLDTVELAAELDWCGYGKGEGPT